tara:strand:- start:117 stop:425 length:309 start_codon:yes stop_codon:yes gene_type:complete
MGNNLHGGDYKNTSIRAINDAVHHSSLLLIRALDLGKAWVFIDVTVEVQEPEIVDVKAVKNSLLFEIVSVFVVKGGLNVLEDGGNDLAVIAAATVIVGAEVN